MNQQSNGYFAPTATCSAFNARQKRAEGRHARAGTPDSEQYMSGVHRTSRRAQKTEAPTVRIQRHWGRGWRTGHVRCAPDCPVHHTTDSLHQRSSLVVGAINTPTTPPFIASKFSSFQPLYQKRSNPLPESDLSCSFELLRLDCFFSFSLVLVIKTPL